MQQDNDRSTSVVSVFDVWAIFDRNWRKPHYPVYEVHSEKVGSAFTLEGAEGIAREVIRTERDSPFRGRTIHSLRVVEIPVGTYTREWKPLSEYIYDHEGRRLAGLPVEGRGYRLKRIVPPPPLIKGTSLPEDPLYRL